MPRNSASRSARFHHYDEVGLLSPTDRSPAGYRIYTADNLQRLQQIVVYRRLGFSLEDVALLLANPESAVDHLRRQKQAVADQLEQLRDLASAINRALENEMNDKPATVDDIKELFGEGYEDAREEAEERWGDTDAWKESNRRTSKFTKADWAEVKAEQDALHKMYTDAIDAGLPATSEAAMDAAEAHRRNITDRFYDCSYRMQRGLADMYISDERFTKTYDDIRPGMAQYVRDSIHANADRHQ